MWPSTRSEPRLQACPNLRLDVPPVSFHDLDLPASGDSSADIARRVHAARERQTEWYKTHEMNRTNADAGGAQTCAGGKAAFAHGR